MKDRDFGILKKDANSTSFWDAKFLSKKFGEIALSIDCNNQIATVTFFKSIHF